MEDGTTKEGDSTDATFEMPGDFFKHPSEGGECYSSCDFYWAWTVAAAIPVVLICICVCICICCLCGFCAAYSGKTNPSSNVETGRSDEGPSASEGKEDGSNETPLLSDADR